MTRMSTLALLAMAASGLAQAGEKVEKYQPGARPYHTPKSPQPVGVLTNCFGYHATGWTPWQMACNNSGAPAHPADAPAVMPAPTPATTPAPAPSKPTPAPAPAPQPPVKPTLVTPPPVTPAVHKAIILYDRAPEASEVIQAAPARR